MLQPMADYSKCRIRITQSNGQGTKAIPDLKRDETRVGIVIIPSAGNDVLVDDGTGGEGRLIAWINNSFANTQVTPNSFEFFRHSHGELPSMAYYTNGAFVTFIEILDVAGAYRAANTPAA